MTLTRELEEKKAELTQIKEQTGRAIREARNKTSIKNDRIEDQLNEVKNLVARLDTNRGSTTSTSDLKELIPKEIAKVKRALQQLDTEIASIEQLNQEMTVELFKGVDKDESKIMIEFMSEIRQESSKLRLETLRLRKEKDQFQASLNTLSQIETMLQLRKDDNEINQQFMLYVRQRVDQKEENKLRRREVMRTERDYLGQMVRDSMTV